MKYSNGFDLDLVLPAMRKRLGWRQSSAPGAIPIGEDNTESISGRYFQSFHALCTPEVLHEVQPNERIANEDFQQYLQDEQDDAILRSLNEVFRQPELIEQVIMYTRYGYNDAVIDNAGTFQAWEINISAMQDITAQITYGTFYFNADVSFNMYLFADGIRQPLATIPVSVVGYERTHVLFEDVYLNAKNGTKYYFGYFQADLGSVKAIREQVGSYGRMLCFGAVPFQAITTTDGTYFNANNRQYPAQPAGVNLEIATFKDHTQRILRKVNLFDEVQGLQMAAMVLEQVNNSTRTNQTQRNTEQSSQQVFMELNQAFATKEVPVYPGFKSNIEREFKRLRDTFFPPEKPVSIDLGGCGIGLDPYEKSWGKQIAESRRWY